MQTPNIISADVAPQFYDSISDRYDKYYAQNQGLLDFVRESLELLPRDAEVLDVGCGTGIPTSLAVTNSGRKVHGIDISRKMIARSRENVPAGTFELRYAEHVPGKFMGEVNTNFLYTQLGWEEVLAENGFEIVKEGKAVFEPPEEAECDREVNFLLRRG
ncbi:uncharacterized protein EAF02_007015 [Botrytis sinoallii]|uniref:uncharacterized protein n=1 Tax=Botrytis sinoallii TaxID=1463999 RepID=UPI0018FF9415|nr:uncharacterized protein EAF02_007015 [Botrytis sinoallii]KAF7881124.1 hypothetical protein EAF02_007015 [Botrytis sinoallii]